MLKEASLHGRTQVREIVIAARHFTLRAPAEGKVEGRRAPTSGQTLTTCEPWGAAIDANIERSPRRSPVTPDVNIAVSF